MIGYTPSRRRRGYANPYNVSPEVKTERSAILLDYEHKRLVAAAEAEVARAREALEKAKNLSVEQSAFDAASAKLAELTRDTTVPKKKAG